MNYQTRSGQPPSFESAQDVSHLRRLSRPPALKPADLPFPKPPADDLIDGPRIALVYGSAPTQIWVSRRVWRRTDGLPEHEFHFQNRWRKVDDWREIDCVAGKYVRSRANPAIEGIASLDDDGFITITTANGYQVPWAVPAQVEVIQDHIHLNPFEAAIAAYSTQRSG